MAIFNIIGNAAPARSKNVSAEETINLFVEKNALYGTPGSVLRTTLPAAGEVRQAFEYQGVCYFVCGNKFYSMTTSLVVTERGTLTTSVGFVSIQSNGLVLLMVDGVGGYTYTIASTTFAAVADVDFPPNPLCCAVLDTIFVVVEGGSQRFFISADGVSWDPADFASAESAPDNLLGVIADHQELILGGVDNIEVWYDSGDATFIFSRRAVIETGLAGPGAMCKADNSVFFLGSDGVVWRLNAYTPTRISGHDIEFAIGGFSTISDCRMWAQKEEGHVFIWCQFPTGNKTFVFDVASGKWHRRAYRDPITGDLWRHRANCYVKFNGMHLTGDFENGKIRELDLDIYDDDGDALAAILIYRHAGGQNAEQCVEFNSFTVGVEAGVGLPSGQGSDPQIMLKWSDDSGHTYGNPVWRSIGAEGNFRQISKWDRLGSINPPNSRVFWLQLSDPTKRVIVSTLLDAT